MLQPPLSSARRVHGLVLIGPIHDTRARREAVLDALHCACRPGPASGLAEGAGASLGLLTVAAAYVSFRRQRTHFLYTLVLLGLNGLVLLALDAVVGVYVLPLRSHNNVFIEHDPWLGWKLRRGLTVVRKERQYTAQETINPVGFRTRPLPFDKPPGVKRILFLGDSHTEGYTVNDPETYPVLVEQH